MAEAVGLAVSIFALIGTFNDCIELLSYISAARSFDHQGEFLSTKLDIQKLRLLQWAERVQLLQGKSGKSLQRSETRACVQRILTNLHRLLRNTSDLQERYGLAEAKSDNVNEKRMESLSNQRLDDFITKLETQLVISDDPSLRKRPGMRMKVSGTLKARWVIHDRAKFADLIEDISTLVDGLNTIVPDKHDATRQMIEDDLARTPHIRTLNLVMEAAKGSSSLNNFVCSAEHILEERAQKRIAEVLWLRCLEERHALIEPAHAKTFDWALKPPPDHAWDDLSEWLASGTGIFWIHGKPGSGKSTLMKYLSTHTQTTSLLTSWSKGSRWIKAHFYFFALGSSDQKSFHGLCRSLLRQILVADSELTKRFLPQMWQEVYRSEKESHMPPTIAELKQAFTELATMDLEHRKICFMIDGLDEFEGDLGSAIAIFQSLERNPNIKLLLSSRPIPQSVDAFGERPQLRLQDLTKGDITIYIRDTIARHRYVSRLERMHPGSIEVLITDLQVKASGVFLWVILACRSVLRGFASYDRLQDLQRRIDELPRELEDLFQLILRRIDKLYWEQAAKLILIAYWSQRAEPSRPISALSLSVLEEHDLDFSKVGAFRRLSEPEKSAQLEMLEGRLMSRCYGLLEAKAVGESGRRLKSGTQYLADDECGIVTFMHRTVFEFLSTPGILELECLRVRDKNFDAYAVLAGISLHAGWVNFEHHEETPVYHLNDSFLYASLASPSVCNTVSLVLSHFALITKSAIDAPYTDNISLETDLRAWTGNACLAIAIAVEVGLFLFVERHPVSCSICKTAYSWHRSLLYHALCKPYFTSTCIMARCRINTFDIVKLLLSNGADADEMFRLDCTETRTPWEMWVYETDPDPALVVDITKLLVESSSTDLSSSAFLKIRNWIKSKYLDKFFTYRRAGAELLEILDAREAIQPRPKKRKGSWSLPSPSSAPRTTKSRRTSSKRGRPSQRTVATTE